jgi:predicted dehydrogenase
VKLGMAVIGAGDFGRNHLKVLSQLPQADLLYVCDQDIERARDAAATYQVADFTADAESLWQDERVKAVVIATSEASHHPLTMAALAAGKHVLIEKPVALDPDSAEEMVRFAEQQGLLLLPGHMLRYDASYNKVKQELESGAFGTLYSIYARRNVPRERFGLHSRTHPVFMALAHDIDIAVWYVQSPVKRVFAMERRTSPEYVNPDIFWGLVEFGNGVIAAFETQWTLPNELGQYLDVRMELMTSKGKVTMQYPGDNLSYMMDGKRTVPDVTLWPELFGIPTGTLRNELEYFISVIQSGKPHVSIRGEEAVQGIHLANMLIESARTGQPIVLGQHS